MIANVDVLLCIDPITVFCLDENKTMNAENIIETKVCAKKRNITYFVKISVLKSRSMS